MLVFYYKLLNYTQREEENYNYNMNKHHYQFILTFAFPPCEENIEVIFMPTRKGIPKYAKI